MMLRKPHKSSRRVALLWIPADCIHFGNFGAKPVWTIGNRSELAVNNSHGNKITEIG